MKKSILPFLSICLITFLSFCERDSDADRKDPIIDIFVLGSSFTNQYVPYLKLLSDSIGDSIFIGEASIGNAGLQVHIEEGNTISKITDYSWDYIMIQ